MLFSNATVVSYINRYFEPTWQSVSELPYIDHGESVQKVAAGNVATFICDANGKVLTILPSLYAAEDYLPALEQARLLARFLSDSEPDGRQPFLKWFHKAIAQRSKSNLRFEELSDGRAAIRDSYGAPLPRALTKPKAKQSELAKVDAPPEPHVDWRASLRKSAAQQGQWQNFTHKQHEMYLQPVHTYLADLAGTVRPDEIARHLFKNLLHVQFLDDLCLAKTQPPAEQPQALPSKPKSRAVTMGSGSK